MMVRYGMVMVGGDLVDELRTPQLKVPVGNVKQSVVHLRDHTKLFVGQMFAVPLDKEEYPYNAFDEVAYQIVSILNNEIQGTNKYYETKLS